MLQVDGLIGVVDGFVFTGLILDFQVFIYHEELVGFLVFMSLLVCDSQMHLNIWMT